MKFPILNIFKSKRGTVCLDFDGVLAQGGEWKGDAVIPDPMPGAKEYVEKMGKTHDLVICSARKAKYIRPWLKKHGFPSIRVTNTKPPAEVYIDDRAIPFGGSFKNLTVKIEGFKPHWKKSIILKGVKLKGRPGLYLDPASHRWKRTGPKTAEPKKAPVKKAAVYNSRRVGHNWIEADHIGTLKVELGIDEDKAVQINSALSVWTDTYAVAIHNSAVFKTVQRVGVAGAKKDVLVRHYNNSLMAAGDDLVDLNEIEAQSKDLDFFIKNSPAYDGSIFNASDKSPKLRGWKTGKVIKLNNMMSFTSDREASKKFGNWTIIVDRAPVESVPISEFSNYPDEMEVLVNKGAQFKITQILHGLDGGTIHMEPYGSSLVKALMDSILLKALKSKKNVKKKNTRASRFVIDDGDFSVVGEVKKSMEIFLDLKKADRPNRNNNHFNYRVWFNMADGKAKMGAPMPEEYENADGNYEFHYRPKNSLRMFLGHHPEDKLRTDKKKLVYGRMLTPHEVEKHSLEFVGIRGRKSPHELLPEDMVDAQAYGKAVQYNKAGDYPLGTWRYDKENGQIDELRKLDLGKITTAESLDSEQFIHGDKAQNVKDYTAAMGKGDKFPPVEAIEMPGGEVKLIDGHRRMSAALANGMKKINGWVNPLFNLEMKTVDGETLNSPEGLTHEYAVHEALKQDKPVGADVIGMYPEIQAQHHESLWRKARKNLAEMGQ